MEARQDQLLLARIDTDVADRENTRHVRLESLGVDCDRALLQFQTPVGDRAQSRRQPEENQQRIQRHARDHLIVGAGQLRRDQATAGLLETGDLTGDQTDPALGDQLVHPGRVGRRGAKLVASMNQHQAVGRMGAVAREIQRPVERGIATSRDHQPLPGERARVAHPVEQLRVLEIGQALDPHPARLEGADAGRDDHGARQKAGAARGLEQETAVVLALQRADRLAKVEGRVKRLDLLQQRLGQFASGDHGNRRNVVDRLVRIQLHALATDMRQ